MISARGVALGLCITTWACSPGEVSPEEPDPAALVGWAPTRLDEAWSVEQPSLGWDGQGVWLRSPRAGIARRIEATGAAIDYPLGGCQGTERLRVYGPGGGVAWATCGSSTAVESVFRLEAGRVRRELSCALPHAVGRTTANLSPAAEVKDVPGAPAIVVHGCNERTTRVLTPERSETLDGTWMPIATDGLRRARQRSGSAIWLSSVDSNASARLVSVPRVNGDLFALPEEFTAYVVQDALRLRWDDQARWIGGADQTIVVQAEPEVRGAAGRSGVLIARPAVNGSTPLVFDPAEGPASTTTVEGTSAAVDAFADSDEFWVTAFRQGQWDAYRVQPSRGRLDARRVASGTKENCEIAN
ncbi:MAG: hypothetical protein R3B82_18430 [Sandaracinaceae bacterium]